LDDGSLPDCFLDFTIMSDLGLSGVTMLPLDCGAVDRVRLLDRPLTGCDITVMLLAAAAGTGALRGFTAT